jgi:flagellar protein FlaG
MADIGISLNSATDLIGPQGLRNYKPLQEFSPASETVPKPDPVEDMTEKAEQESFSEEEKGAFEAAIQQLDELVKPLSIGLSVQRIETLNRFYVELFDRDTGEVLREIPARKIIELQENLRAFQGLLFDRTT